MQVNHCPGSPFSAGARRAWGQLLAAWRGRRARTEDLLAGRPPLATFGSLRFTWCTGILWRFVTVGRGEGGTASLNMMNRKSDQSFTGIVPYPIFMCIML